MQINKILVPYDNSSYSEKSLEYAVNLLKLISSRTPHNKTARIIMLHVVEDIPTTPSLFDRPIRNSSGKVVPLSTHIATIYKEMEEEMRKKMDEKRDKYIDDPGMQISTVIEYGNPADRILDYSSKNKVDLIVMGSQGLRGLAKIKGLGSVSRKVSERVSCPITIIR